MNQGRIIEYIEQGNFVCTLCLQDKGTRLHLLTSSNREINIASKRAFLISLSSMDIQKPRDFLLDMLKQSEKAREQLKEQVNVRELWELLKDEDQTFDNRYLSQLAFGHTVSDDHISALVRALFENPIYFKVKDECFYANSETKIQQIIKQKEEEALKQERLVKGSEWLKRVNTGNCSEIPSCSDYVIKLLVQLALYGADSPDYKHGRELLSISGISDISESRKLLQKMGVWEEDENIELLKSNIETSFNEKELDEALVLHQSQVDFSGYENFLDLNIFTIDGQGTSDFDDAISFEMDGENIRLGIHIADVAAYIPTSSLLDNTAMNRGSSLYLPRKQIPMFPDNLSHDILSLKEGVIRPALSLVCTLNKAGDIMESRFLLSQIEIKKKFTYDQVNDLLDNKKIADRERDPFAPYIPVFEKLFDLSRTLRRKRMNQDAINLSLPEVVINFREDSSISLSLVEQNSPSRMMIAEFMILYNHLTAEFCKKNAVPILYRTQTSPKDSLCIDDNGYLFYVFQQRRKLSPMLINTSPDPHRGLGLETYTQCTSPIRRYMDLVVQRQMRSFLLNKPLPYEKSRLDEIRIHVEPVIKTLQRIQRDRIRYWTLKYFNQNRGKQYKAIVLDEMKNKYRIVICDCLFLAEIRRKAGMILSPGEEILVEVKSSDPWDGTIRLEHAD